MRQISCLFDSRKSGSEGKKFAEVTAFGKCNLTEASKNLIIVSYTKHKKPLTFY